MSILRNLRFFRCPPPALGIFFLLAALPGCRPLWLSTVDPPGTPEYKLGWEDGCDSGLSAEGTWDYKLMYGFKKRPEMSSSDQYKSGWSEGFSYCRYSYGASKAGELPNNLGWGD